MKRIALVLGLLLAPALAHAQCNGAVPNGTICGNVTGSTNTMRPTSTSVITGIPGGSNGQIQYNNAGAFGGFTAGGALSFSVPNFTLTPLAVTNAKLALMTQNTLKGAATSTTPADLVAPSCSAARSALQWVTNNGLQCATLGDVVGPASSTDNAAARFDSTTGKLLQNSALIIADTTAALSRSGGGGIALQALTAGTAIPAGDVGELLTAEVSFASRTAMTSATSIAVTSLIATPGVWDCSGNHGFETSGGGVATEYHIEISTTAPPGPLVTAPNNGCTQGTHLTYIANQGQVFPNGPCQILATTNTTLYLKSYSTFTNNQTAYGFLRCRRH